MKHITRLFTLLFALCLSSMAMAQQSFKVHFAHGTEVFPENFREEMTKPIPTADIANGFFVRYVQFNTLPSTEQQAALEREGAIWNGYVNYGAYRMLLPEGFDLTKMESLGARSIMAPQTRWKMHRNLVERPFGQWAVHEEYVDLVVQVYPFVSIENGALQLESKRIQVLQKGNQNGALKIRVKQDEIESIVNLPYVRWAELMPEPPKKDDTNGRSLHRSSMMDSDHASGLKFNGEGVNVLVRDDGAVGPHIDFQGRLYNQDGAGAPLDGTHGDGVAGIIGGAGNVDPTKKGMAAGAKVYVVDYVNDFQDETLPLFQNENVTITNSSYSDGCNAGYTLATQTVDEQIFQNPTLMHVFSAGNSNSNDCGYGAGNQWGNITGGHKMAKNAIATANLQVDADIEPSSSRGPAHDGRLKPDIAAHGAEQNSTDPNNAYQVFGGTSAAAPGIAGCLAQLTHAYKTFNSGQEAPTALLKLALMTTANEMGNIGPDYIFGWGHVNNFRAMRLLQSNRYTSGNVENGQSKTHTVTIPSQTKQAKLMIYWAERPSDENTARALINDLDITVTAPNGTVFRPWRLDPTPDIDILNTPAGVGRDSLNNMEQVAIENPAAGTYTVTVNGFEVPFGPQPYYLAWEFLDDRVLLAYPSGGESFVPGAKEWIRWDAYGDTNPFSLRYSVDGGNTFITINGAIPATQRMLEWTVPTTAPASGKVHMMIVRSNRRDTTDFPLSIVAQPTNLQIAKVCPDSITLKWTKIANDTIGYDVLTLGDKYMELKGVSPAGAQSYTIPISDPLAQTWYSVRSSHPSGLVGRRVNAIQWAGGLKECPQPFDASISQITAPAGSSILNCGASEQPVSIIVENQGLNPIEGATVRYSLDGGTPVTENLPSIAVGSTLEFTFATPLVFTQNGQATIEVHIDYAGDNFVNNNTITRAYTVVVQTASGQNIFNFEATPTLPVGWSIANPDGLDTWEPSPIDVTGANGQITAAMWVNHFSYNPASQQEDYLYMVPWDLTGIASPSLEFDYAHSEFDATYVDGLRVEAFVNCDLGAPPVVLWEALDPDYATVPAQTDQFFPDAAGDWRHVSIPMGDYAGQTVVVRFASINGFGNNAFLDNVGVLSVVPVLPVAQFSAPDTVCRNQPIELTADPSPGATDTYSWLFGNSAVPGSASGPGPHAVTYPLPGNRTIRLIVSNGFGSDTITKTIHIRSNPTANFSQAQAPTGLEVTFTNTSANATSFLWEFGDGNTSTMNNPVHTYAAPGTYAVKLTSTNPCSNTSKTVNVTLVSNTAERVGLDAVRILPNPNNGKFEVAISNSSKALDLRLQLFDAAGRLVTERNIGKLTQGTTTISFNDLQLPSGTYQLSLASDKGTASFPVIVVSDH
jgi:PKD repeat protein